jgi:hypothetical protein
MCTDSSMGHAMQDAPGVVLKPGHNSRACEQCGGKFSPRAGSGGKPQKFCSPQCRTAFHAAQPNVSQRSPTCSAQTRLPAVIPPAKKDEPADAGKDFDWQKANDDVVLRVRPETAVYFNPYGALVIRQHGWPDDDSIVVISADSVGRQKHKASGPRFVALYHYMLKSAAWRDLDPISRCLYVELKSRYMGLNNGEIPYSVREGAKELRVSKATVSRSFRQLIDHGFIAITKAGHFGYKVRHATEWRLTEFGCGNDLATKEYMRWQPPGGSLATAPCEARARAVRRPLEARTAW